MKKVVYITIVALLSFIKINAQKVDSLTINYYENFPYAYVESGKLKGIEIDILNEYINWLKEKKKISVVVTYNPFKEFSGFYASVKNGTSKTVGLGSVTNRRDRETEITFSPPYLKNVAVLITDGSVTSVKSKSASEIKNGFANYSAIAVNKSSHLDYITELQSAYLPELKITITESQNKVLETISTTKNTFGYVDIVAYWAYLKSNPTKSLKIQKEFSEPKEYFVLAMPLKSVHSAYINEFFESGFGFTSTKAYHQILEKYLGYEIIESVEIK